MTVHVDIVSAEKEIFSGDAEMVFAPAIEGEVGIAPGHAPLLSRLGPGEVRIKLAADSELVFYVSGGMLEVQPTTVTILSDTAERAEDLDEALLVKAKESAEAALSDTSSNIDYAKARVELAETIAQLQAIQRLRRRSGR